MVKEENAMESEALVRALLERLHLRGYKNIRAAQLEDYEGNRPPMVYWESTDLGERPDAFARIGDIPALFQVETAGTISGDRATRRMALFSAWAAHRRALFCLLVPEEVRVEGRALLALACVDERYVHLASA